MGNATSNSTFSDKTTASQVADIYNSRIKNKYILITGAATGIGHECASVLYARGAHVFVAARGNKASAAVEKIINQVGDNANKGTITPVEIDLLDYNSINKFADEYIESGKPLHILINNAGVMACPKSLNNGLELQFATNHVGHFLLTKKLLPTIIATGNKEDKSSPARIINLSSMGHAFFSPPHGISFDDLDASKSYNPWMRYGESKLANILFTKELVKRYGNNNNLLIAAVHPGAIMGTDLARHFSFSVICTMISSLWRNGHVFNAFNNRYKSIEEGAATSIYCALSPDVVQGEYYSDCKIETKLVNPLIHNVELANKLWDISEELVK